MSITKPGLLLKKNVLWPLSRGFLIPSQLTAVASAADAGIHESNNIKWRNGRYYENNQVSWRFWSLNKRYHSNNLK